MDKNNLSKEVQDKLRSVLQDLAREVYQETGCSFIHAEIINNVDTASGMAEVSVSVAIMGATKQKAPEKKPAQTDPAKKNGIPIHGSPDEVLKELKITFKQEGE